MPDELFNTVGPEGRNVEAEIFEDQLVALGETLGWKYICRNIDVFISDDDKVGRGIDVLWAVRNPREDRVEGWIGEAKRKQDGSTFSGSVLRSDVVTLREKVAKFDRDRFYNNAHVRRSGISHLAGGILALSSDGFDDVANYGHLEDIEFTHSEEGENPTQVLFLGPSTLNGLADCARQLGTPKRYFWPPTARHLEGTWSDACPPEQVAAGLLAYKSEAGRVVLWVRDTLAHHDIGAFALIARAWRMRFHEVAFTALTAQDWRIVQDGWRFEATRFRSVGGKAQLPDNAHALHTSTESMKEFDAVWRRAAA